MSTTRTVASNSNLAGLDISGVISRTGTSETNVDVSVGAGLSSTLTTRTDPDTGVFTMDDSAHGLLVADVVDVFWVGGGRRGMKVSAVSGSLVTLGTAVGDIGIGDPLPVVATVVILSKQYPVTIAVIAAKVTLASARATGRCAVEFQTSANVLVKLLDLCRSGNANEYWEWHDQADEATPFGADIARLLISNGQAVSTNFRFGALLKT